MTLKYVSKKIIAIINKFLLWLKKYWKTISFGQDVKRYPNGERLDNRNVFRAPCPRIK